jgi:hypothetical protein
MQMRTIRPFERLEGFEHFERMLLIVGAVSTIQPVQAVGEGHGFKFD